MSSADVAENARASIQDSKGIGGGMAVRLVREDVGRRPLDDTEQETGVDASAARVIARARLLMLGVVLFTFVSVAGVFGVIGYRVYGSAAVPDRPIESTVTLPRGAKILQTAVSDGRVIVTIEAGGSVEIRSFDAKTLKPVGRLSFGEGR